MRNNLINKSSKSKRTNLQKHLHHRIQNKTYRLWKSRKMTISRKNLIYCKKPLEKNKNKILTFKSKRLIKIKLTFNLILTTKNRKKVNLKPKLIRLSIAIDSSKKNKKNKMKIIKIHLMNN